ncbi:hypothetical protein HZA44_00925, partial [Candidatus Peregrinibacteria bacterium]|nr:hypothetical protein [Candidatus Peregrinibacteria bacterium]
MNESHKDPTIAPEHNAPLLKEAKLWIRRMSLLLLFSSSTALGAEKPETATPWAGQSFPCYASDKKEVERVAAETFKAKFGTTQEKAGVSLSIEFNENTGRAMVTVRGKARKTEIPNQTDPWAGQSFPCYASDKKEAERVAAETFKAKFGTTQEKAGVSLSIEFNENTGRAMVTVR